MKTVKEIRETIEETKYRLSKMEMPTSYHDEMWDSQLAEMDGWINALEWVLEGEDAIEEEREAEEGETPKRPDEGTTGESQVQRHLRLIS